MVSGAVMARDDAENYLIKKLGCESKMHVKCVKQVFSSIFEVGTVTDSCCYELAKSGPLCHFALAYRTLQTEFKTSNASKILVKSTHVWSRCLALSSQFGGELTSMSSPSPAYG
ncbi:hypothetical protein SLEP1_g31385 [Rubroshorea leprosula]|uniref:Prolamin-like domain-containing protein n=1 Tax=Rubroshorea leprosula TaxID=152421 RepID=A0AAV5K5F4_9ROSI|nr:hypothetical protein SLEP1_g31385 [Rubroshorea leprosula]